jgi:hypothetical protein
VSLQLHPPDMPAPALQTPALKKSQRISVAASQAFQAAFPFRSLENEMKRSGFALAQGSQPPVLAYSARCCTTLLPQRGASARSVHASITSRDRCAENKAVLSLGVNERVACSHPQRGAGPSFPNIKARESAVHQLIPHLGIGFFNGTGCTSDRFSQVTAPNAPNQEPEAANST